ncbi:hypothetical protein [Streptomyces noursei]|uniref:hypothetical protein n=1 Tax=Streptomyces noursei TaxID=1971 RepID=UPI0016734DB9|nr:hypothetical protein [Streptomyces noursei]MCZ1020456.1 hypothetical protein [Streptomyces noursei]
MRPTLPVGVADAAVDHPDRRVRGLLAEAQPRAEAAGLHRLPPHTANLLAADPTSAVRAVVRRNAWPQMADPVRRHLRADRDDTVRAAALLQHHQDPRGTRCPGGLRRRVPRAVTDPRLSAASAVQLLDDPHERVRRAVRGHPAPPVPALPADVMRQDAGGDPRRAPHRPGGARLTQRQDRRSAPVTFPSVFLNSPRRDSV